MALTFNATHPIGYIKTKDGENWIIAEGNAMAVIVQEFPKHWQLQAFFTDKTHMKRCLGLAYGYQDLFRGKDGKTCIASVKLNTWHKEAMTLIEGFTRAGYKVTAYYKEPKQDKRHKAETA